MIVGARFAYGLRIAGPILIGTSPVAPARFASFGAIVWAASVGSLGWLFGAAAERLLGDVHRVEIWLFAALAAIGFGLALAHAWRRRRRRDRGLR